MKEKINEQLVSVLETYNDPDEVIILAEQTDFEGNDCFWYLDEFNLFEILACIFH